MKCKNFKFEENLCEQHVVALLRNCFGCFPEKQQNGVLFQMYSLTNILVLYIGCGMDWFSHVTETTYIANFSDWLCRVWQFMYKVIIYAAGWIVVSMVIDRFIILWHPRQAPYMCTVFMAKLVMIIIVIGLVVVSVHAMWTYELNAQGCSVDPMQQDFQTLAWPWISAALCSYIPLVLIFLFSIVITIGLVCPRADAVSVTNMNQSTQDQLTKLTLVVGFVFLTLNLPTIIVNIIEYSNRAVGYALWAKFLLARVIGQTISCLNCAASFFLYFAFVPQMRKDFMELVKRMKKSNTSSIEEMQTIEVNSNREKYLTKSEQDTTSATQV